MQPTTEEVWCIFHVHLQPTSPTSSTSPISPCGSMSKHEKMELLQTLMSDPELQTDIKSLRLGEASPTDSLQSALSTSSAPQPSRGLISTQSSTSGFISSPEASLTSMVDYRKENGTSTRPCLNTQSSIDGNYSQAHTATMMSNYIVPFVQVLLIWQHLKLLLQPLQGHTHQSAILLPTKCTGVSTELTWDRRLSCAATRL